MMADQFIQRRDVTSFVLVGTCLASLLLSPPKAQSAEFDELRRQWTAMKQSVARLEAKAYSENPELREWEIRLAESRERFQRRANRVEIAEFFKKYPEKTNQYKEMLDASKGIAAADIMTDPAKLKIAKEVSAALYQRDRAKKELEHFKDFESYWNALQASMLKRRDRAIQEIERLKQSTEFPAMVIEEACLDAISQINSESLYVPIIELKTPTYLKDAREELHRLEIKMTTLFPHWYETELQTQKETGQTTDENMSKTESSTRQDSPMTPNASLTDARSNAAVPDASPNPNTSASASETSELSKGHTKSTAMMITASAIGVLIAAAVVWKWRSHGSSRRRE